MLLSDQGLPAPGAPPADQASGVFLVVQVAVLDRPVGGRPGCLLGIAGAAQSGLQPGTRLRLAGQDADCCRVGRFAVGRVGRRLGAPAQTRSRGAAGPDPGHTGARTAFSALSLSRAISSSPSLRLFLRNPSVCSRPCPTLWPL